ncbi:MAG: hypothetical protein ACQGVK_07755 [Myxococcota bacterium]
MAPSAERDQIVPFAESHRSDVLRLRAPFRGISPAWNAEHFRWQQEENPWFEGHQIQLALHDGRVVGMRVLQAAEWEVGGPAIRFRAPCYVGTVIEEGHRSRGLMSRLSRAIEDQIERSGGRFALNLNAGPVTHIGALAEGWRSLGAFGASIRERGGEGFGPLQRATRALRRGLSALLPLPGAGLSLANQPRPEEMAELAATTRDPARIRHVKDERWFRWRYRDPSSRYRFAYFRRAGRLVGYMVFHRTAAPLAAGPLDLADWERDAELPWTELLGVAVRLADRWVLPLTAWSAALPEAVRPGLVRLGFTPRPLWGPLARRRPTFLVGRIDRAADQSDRAWEIGPARIDEVDHWDIRPIYADPF